MFGAFLQVASGSILLETVSLSRTCDFGTCPSNLLEATQAVLSHLCQQLNANSSDGGVIESLLANASGSIISNANSRSVEFSSFSSNTAVNGSCSAGGSVS